MNTPNIYAPERQKDDVEEESFADYKERRAKSNAWSAVSPYQPRPEKELSVKQILEQEHQEHLRTAKFATDTKPAVLKPAFGQNPKFAEPRHRKPHKPTEPFVSKVGKPKRAWCPTRLSAAKTT